MKADPRFIYIFWFLVGCVAFVFAYVALITFLPIPRANIRFADSALSFLLGTVVGGGAFGYLTGRSVGSNDKTTPTGTPGTTTADISVTATTITDEAKNNKTDNTNSNTNN